MKQGVINRSSHTIFELEGLHDDTPSIRARSNGEYAAYNTCCRHKDLEAKDGIKPVGIFSCTDIHLGHIRCGPCISEYKHTRSEKDDDTPRVLESRLDSIRYRRISTDNGKRSEASGHTAGEVSFLT